MLVPEFYIGIIFICILPKRIVSCVLIMHFVLVLIIVLHLLGFSVIGETLGECAVDFGIILCQKIE